MHMCIVYSVEMCTLVIQTHNLWGLPIYTCNRQLYSLGALRCQEINPQFKPKRPYKHYSQMLLCTTKPLGPQSRPTHISPLIPSESQSLNGWTILERFDINRFRDLHTIVLCTGCVLLFCHWFSDTSIWLETIQKELQSTNYFCTKHISTH